MHIKYLVTKLNNAYSKIIHFIVISISLLIFVLFYKYFYMIIQPIRIYPFILICSIIYFITLLITTLFHEFGHLVFGLLTKYEFSSIQIWNFILFSSNKHLIFKKLPNQFTNPQCIMIPPLMNSAIPPYLLYNLGGVFFNILQFLISLKLISLRFSPYPNFFQCHLCIHSIFAIVFNLLPVKGFGSFNDGKIILSLLKDDSTKKSYYWHLQFYRDLQNGIQPRILLSSPYLLDSKPTIGNIFDFDNQIVKYYGYLDERNFLMAKDILIPLYKNIDFLSEENKKLLNAEYIFIQIVLNSKENNLKISVELFQYLETARLPYTNRILVAYYTLSGKIEKSQKYYSILKEQLAQYPFIGLSTMEYQLSSDIINKNIIKTSNIYS